MASAQIAGVYSIYIVAPSGNRRLIKSAANYVCAPGGSPDGVIANTPEKWSYLPLSNEQGSAGYSIEFTLTAGANATSDASDAIWVLPITVSGQAQTIGNDQSAGGMGNSNFTVDLANADRAYVANVETPVARYRAKEGVNFRIGGGAFWLTHENNG
jgi:hypothetical protein